MKKETKIQVEGELEKVENDIHRMQYHLNGLNSEKRKTEKALEEMKNRKEKLKSYL
ncbi:hypothetical protein [Bacillus wiedmannii]|uniref:hypothetical protein n=1 Tax=Bacillus wiedmannii TaxID=1890302 RepID=UPI000869ED2B|nr:hypothetical protein [Bacillus wiedmannii]SCN11868.1 Uncharacterized protein BCRIVMBC126_05743 [Bacillus wiedmannii]